MGNANQHLYKCLSETEDIIPHGVREFQAEYKTSTKGPLALLIQLTRLASEKQFPLDSGDFLTENKGQIAGISGANLKKILKEHGITRTLASEGGRTSRGNMGLMGRYIDFLNEIYGKLGNVDFKMLEAHWAEQIREFFRNQPFTLSADVSKTVAANLNEMFEQARARQRQNPGTQYLGAMLQYLVAAKLLLIMPQGDLEVHGAFVADTSTDRGGDFRIGGTIIHCTSAPGEPLIQKCKINILAGYRPIIITVFDRVRTALDLATDAGIDQRVDVWDVQQFISINVDERSLFNVAEKNASLADIIESYNKIIDTVETDPSLHIEFESK